MISIMANGEWGVYRGAVNLNNPEDIQHWKYIKKYRTGDKWRYVYADEQTHNSINRVHSQYQTAKENANRYGEAANKYEKQWNTAGLFKNNPNSAAAAERYKKNYYEAEAKASKSKKAAPQYYKSYVASVEKNSVSKILSDKLKPWKKASEVFFNAFSGAAKELIERKRADMAYKEAVRDSRRIQRKEDRKNYNAGVVNEVKNQINYATHPSQWFQPYKSASTKNRERAEAAQAEYRKKHPISTYFNDRQKKRG